MSNPNITESYQLKPELSVRLVVCDHYLTRPTPGIDVLYSDFRGSDIKQVPVLRIFGPTPDGRKACLHIHGVFPYFYVPCPTSKPEPQFLYQIAVSLDKALNIALKQAMSANQHVYKISLVKGLPFYGFHDKEHLYLKVFLYSPNLIKQAVELCANGAILGKTFQPHESHLNFTLQFFIDFNLFGMSNIDLQTVKFRKTGISQNSIEILESPNEFGLKPESSCFYEADCIASHIINRQRIGKGDGVENPGLEEVWNQEIERRKQLNISIASKSLSQCRVNTEETDSHLKFEKLMIIKVSNLIDKPVDINNDVRVPMQPIHYPAESMEGSQLFNAVDVSVHLPESTIGASSNDFSRRDLDETLTEDLDETVVDENVALNCSLHYSQVHLNSEDMDLVDLLQVMDEKPIEEDSIMGTPANVDNENDTDLDDAEYSQIFNEETICLDHQSKEDSNESNSSPAWNDSFWDGANIPQLDGTFDDDHVKKVRKRKMRPFKLGLSKPKVKKNVSIDSINPAEIKNNSDMDISENDVINESRETIDDISDSHLKMATKVQSQSILKKSKSDNNAISDQVKDDEESIVKLVHKVSLKHDNIKAAEKYDLERKFEPVAGPSNANLVKDFVVKSQNDWSLDLESSPEDNNLGIMSFYNMSKIFDVSVKEKDEIMENSDSDQQSPIHLPNQIMQNVNKTDTQNIKSMKHAIVLTPKIKPPTRNYIIAKLDEYNIPKVVNPAPFYSNHKDVGDKVEIGQMMLKLQSKLSRDQKPFDRVLDTTTLEEWRQLLFLQTNEMSQESSKPSTLKMLLAGNKKCVLEPIQRPPTSSKVKEWLSQKNEISKEETLDSKENISKIIDDLENSQALGLNEDEIDCSISLEGDKEKADSSLQVTMQPDGSFLCFGGTDQKESCSIETAVAEVNFLTLMLVEIHTTVRVDLNPDPAIDPIEAMFIKVTNDCPPNHFLSKTVTEILVVDDKPAPKHLDRCVFDHKVTYFSNENEIFERLIELVNTHDPDIMCGYEIEMNSWGYVLERAQVLGLEIVKDISRITEKYRQKRWRGDENDFEGRIIGRVMFNVWRLFRYELALSSYSFENCMYEILKERVPKYSYAQLSKWWCEESRILRWIPVEYYLTKLSGTVRMLEKLDIINRTSELARLFGLQWWEVLSRGSQFRVESLMLRAARPLNLVALSPTVKQRAAMRAPECLPLIFEPESRFYADPVIVLDFQSLYPSMMIAYNYCFSTCIGRVQNIDGDASYEFGAWRLRVPKAKLEGLVKKGLVHWSPVGVGFVKPSVRRGVLPALLRRILAARQAVKKNMKLQTNESVKKAMHSRQLGLKLIANVTYGYTAANFSGRMPCVEVGDSVVAKGRETLERAIKLVRDNPEWNAKVVYGDTDSMFVQVPGGTRAEAFRVGQQIADAVTADNPAPVALKLEKVYQPCILQTKKRYVGFMYEGPDQEKPVYEAKGIETVRRDGCPAGVKLLQQSLCELFTSGDMSAVKRGVQGALSRLVGGAVPPRDLMFTREYRGGTAYRAVAPPLEIAKRLKARDRRAEPRTGERLHWVITAGAPGAALVRLARTPAELVRDPSLGPHVGYYAARALLPPLHRCLSLLGADVFKWWNELGYTREAQQREQYRGGIARYMSRDRCAVCSVKFARNAATGVKFERDASSVKLARTSGVCGECAGGRHAGLLLAARANAAQTYLQNCDNICKSCVGHKLEDKCENTECPVLWRRISARQKLKQVYDVIETLPVQCNETYNF